MLDWVWNPTRQPARSCAVAAVTTTSGASRDDMMPSNASSVIAASLVMGNECRPSLARGGYSLLDLAGGDAAASPAGLGPGAACLGPGPAGHLGRARGQPHLAPPGLH